MRISDFLSKEAIGVNLQATDKKGVITELVELLVSAKKIDERDRGKLVHSLLERESLGSTGVGHGIGIPHGKLEGVRELVAASGSHRRGSTFNPSTAIRSISFSSWWLPKIPPGPISKPLPEFPGS